MYTYIKNDLVTKNAKTNRNVSVLRLLANRLIQLIHQRNLEQKMLRFFSGVTLDVIEIPAGATSIVVTKDTDGNIFGKLASLSIILVDSLSDSV